MSELIGPPYCWEPIPEDADDVNRSSNCMKTMGHAGDHDRNPPTPITELHPLNTVEPRGVGRKSEEVKCPIPGCTADLAITWFDCRVLSWDDTVRELCSSINSFSSTWEIGCTNGHKILLPVDTAQDDYEFGLCKCDPDDLEDDDNCGHGDMNRLHRVLALRKDFDAAL